MTGTGVPSSSLTMVRVELSSPPGVSSWMIKARASPALARPMLSRMKSSTAGLMLPSMVMRSTCGPETSFVCANTDTAAASNTTKEKILRVFTAQLLDDFLDIFPDQLFVGRIAQQIGWMKGRHELDSMIMMPGAAELADGNLALRQRLHRKLAQAYDDLRAYQINLFLKKGLAGRHLVRLGVAIFRWPAFDHVRDIDILAFEPHAFGNDIVQ